MSESPPLNDIGIVSLEGGGKVLSSTSTVVWRARAGAPLCAVCSSVCATPPDGSDVELLGCGHH
jgi:hypothetical protein